MAQFQSDCEGFARRDFLKIGAAGLFGLSLPQLLQMEARANETAPANRQNRRATSVIMVWLSGGPATIDMWDLRPNAPEGIRGEFRQIPTTADGSSGNSKQGRALPAEALCGVLRSMPPASTWRTPTSTLPFHPTPDA